MHNFLSNYNVTMKWYVVSVESSEQWKEIIIIIDELTIFFEIPLDARTSNEIVFNILFQRNLLFSLFWQRFFRLILLNLVDAVFSLSSLCVCVFASFVVFFFSIPFFCPWCVSCFLSHFHTFSTNEFSIISRPVIAVSFVICTEKIDNNLLHQFLSFNEIQITKASRPVVMLLWWNCCEQLPHYFE